MSDIAVIDAEDRQRYEISVDGVLAGFAEYRLLGGRRHLVHTETLPAFEGQGLGSRLAHDALDMARRSGEPVVARCPFIRSYIERHPGHEDLLDRAAAPQS